MNQLVRKAGIISVAASFFVSASLALAGENAGKPALTVRTTQLKTEHWSRTIAANGSILPWQEAVVGAELSGLRITAINVNVGDEVKKGDVLATLATETLQANVAEARAALQESEAVLADALANAERSRKLSASGFVSEQQAAQTATSEQTARARVEVQKARVEASLVRLGQAQIVAQEAGIISASSAAVGTLTQSGAELFRLIRNGRMEWFAELTAEELAVVKKGMVADVTVGTGKVIRGRVRAVAPSVNAQTRHGQAIVRFADNVSLVGGLFARGNIDVSGGAHGIQSLPLGALMQRGNKNFVLVVSADSRVREQQVTVGQRNGDRVEIRDGLKADDAVVESGGAFLTEGDVVQRVKN